MASLLFLALLGLWLGGCEGALTSEGCFDVHHPGYNPFRPASLGKLALINQRARSVAQRVFPIATGRGLTGLATEGPRSCLLQCKNLGYDFAGVEDTNGIGTDNICLCGGQADLARAQPKPEGCSETCPDRGTLRCGDAGGTDYVTRARLPEMSVYSDPEVPRRVAESVGCFAFPTEEAPVFESEMGKAVSPSACLGHCYDVGYDAAGLNNGGDCFCGTAEQMQAAGSATGCVVRCASGVDVCGGVSTDIFRRAPAPLSVYREQTSGVISVEMLGCYRSQPRADAPRSLKVQVPRVARPRETPERCVRSCNQWGFSHAGLENGNRCFCGSPSDIVENRRIDMASCTSICQGPNGASRSCGGGFGVAASMTVYRNTAFTPLTLQEVGCATVTDVQKAPQIVVDNFQSQTPESCVNECVYNGYQYAAVEYSRCSCLTEALFSRTERDVLGRQKARVDTVGVTGCVRLCRGKTASDTYKYCGGSTVVSIYALAEAQPA